jgi:pimeloyl-ACP methyl ester carboxylesterase
MFEDAPSLPAWLEGLFPFGRRIYREGEYAIHFVDEGTGPAVLLQHGNPTWSFLWRKVIPHLIDAGLRVVAPDLIGLGLSDKPRNPRVHTPEFHAGQIAALIAALDLDGVTVAGQDWGGPILGLVAARHPERVAGAVFANTILTAPRRARPLSWFHRVANAPVVSALAFRVFGFPIGILDRVQGDRRSIGPEEKRAYRYPLRAFRDRAGPLALARMVPQGPEHASVSALREVEAWAASYQGPVRLVWGIRDPILGRGLKAMRRLFPIAPVVETNAGHFLQEEVPELLAEAIIAVAKSG